MEATKPKGLEEVAILIIKTPAGEAPEWVRRRWVGLILPAHRTPESGERIQFGLGTGNPVPKQQTYSVSTGVALAILLERSEEAVDWFRTYTGVDAKFPFSECHYLVFGADEVEVLTSQGKT